MMYWQIHISQLGLDANIELILIVLAVIVEEKSYEELAMFIGVVMSDIDPNYKYKTTPQIANIFIPTDTTDTLNPIGTGYIGATAHYNHIYDDDTSHFYILCNAIEIVDYNEWFTAATYLANVDNYVESKATVYPNPTSGVTFVTLHSDYITTFNVQSVTYSLYNNETLLTTLTPDNVNNVIEIPSAYINTSGSYYIICSVEYLSPITALTTETVTLPFTVIQ